MSGSVRQPNFAWRYFVVLAVFGLLAVIVSGRLIYLQIESQAFLQDQGDRRVIRVENIPAVLFEQK